MGLKLHTFTRVFNWCVSNGCPKFTASHNLEKNCLDVHMIRQKFEVYLPIDLLNYMTEMTIVKSNDNMDSVELVLEECLNYVLELESIKDEENTKS